MADSSYDVFKSETEHSYNTIVQIRQNAGYRRNLYQIEALLVKTGYSKYFIEVLEQKEGIDIYVHSKPQAEKIVDIIAGNAPTQVKESTSLISVDPHCNLTNGNQDWSIHVNIASIVKDDLVKTSHEMTGMPLLMVVTKVSATVRMIDPSTLRRYDLPASQYFKSKPRILLTCKELTRFVVLDIVLLDAEKDDQSQEMHKHYAEMTGEWTLAEAEVSC
jgi:NMD protein affecting ribosome stability and mRNA decay